MLGENVETGALCCAVQGIGPAVGRP